MKHTLIPFFALFLIFSLLVKHTNAQFSVDTKIEDLYKVNIINPGISLEKKIIKYSTIQANIYWNTTINKVYNTNLNTKQYSLFLDPSLNIQYRYYHNYYKRADKGKNVENNGANFIGAIAERSVTRFSLNDNTIVEKARPVIKIGAIYGLQRTFFKYVLVEGYLGAGYQWETKSMQTSDGNSTKYQNGSFGVFGQLNIGIPVL